MVHWVGLLSRIVAFLCHFHLSLDVSHMGRIGRKPVFGVSNKVSFKQISSVTETSYKMEISPEARLYMKLKKSE